MKRSLTFFLIAVASLLFATSASAEDFDVRPGTSNASFTSNAPLETINGTSSAVSGTISATLEDPTSLRGTIIIPVATLRTGVDDRDSHLQSGDWLGAEENANITFEATSIERRGGASELSHGQTAQLAITGDMTINGVTQEITVPAQATYYVIKGSELEGTHGIDNNLIRIISNFSIELDQFDVGIPAPLRAKVSNQIDLQIRLTAIEQDAGE